MIRTKIAQLEISDNVKDTDFVIVDNTEVTKRATVGVLSETLKNSYELSLNTYIAVLTSTASNILTSFNSIQAEVDAAIATITNNISGSVISSLSGVAFNSLSGTISNIISGFEQISADFATLSTNVQNESNKITSDFAALSTFVDEKINQVTLNEAVSTFVFTESDSSKMIYYSGVSNISAYITPAINTSGYTVSVAQLSAGSITLALSSSYTTGKLIAYGDLVTTAGPGSTANVIRINSNNYLITGLLQ
jgi:hypothetical protein